ncbi:MAG: RNA 2',3'-cyclic phosphodiesterase [Firmicutes bacterium]|nr:RNA 2',3'-cyclic phosphodiesterase [Bacillota bacterium]
MRLFVGIELPSHLKHVLYNISEPLRSQLSNTRWVSPENIHLTLKFLGSTEDEKLDEIVNAIENAIKNFRKFYFSLDSVGGFPSSRKARVLWVGISHGSSELIELSKAIEESLAPLGFEIEKKPFKPHITLARIRIPTSIESAATQMPSGEISGRVVNVDGITIFQSRLKPTGAEYEAIRFIPLQG